jgi:hypothetical protein
MGLFRPLPGFRYHLGQALKGRNTSANGSAIRHHDRQHQALKGRNQYTYIQP